MDKKSETGNLRLNAADDLVSSPVLSHVTPQAAGLAVPFCQSI